MKKTILIITVSIHFFVNACKEKEQVAPISKGPTSIVGRITEINSDKPAPNVDVYLWKYADRMGNIRELVDETVSDSNGNYTLEFDVDRTIYVSANFYQTGYISYKHAVDPTYGLDGKVHQHNIEMIPPAWVNVRMVNKHIFSNYDEVGVGSKNFTGGNVDFNIAQDTTIVVKVFGNMSDTISLAYWNLKFEKEPKYTLLKLMKFPITVPGFQFKDLLIEY